MGGMFYKSEFNGDISRWDVSHAENIDYMFSQSKFNGDISNWDVSSKKMLDYISHNLKDSIIAKKSW